MKLLHKKIITFNHSELNVKNQNQLQQKFKTLSWPTCKSLIKNIKL